MKVLLKTRLRRKLLAYSFAHQDKDYYVRELASFINEDPGNLSRELRRLEEEGLYKSVTRGNTKFYSLNKKYPLFKEFKVIISKTEGVEASLREIVSGYDQISLAFIYGSYAKNKENVSSDIDLVIVGSPNHDKFTQDIRGLESKLDREINFNIYKEDEFEQEKKRRGGFLNLVLKDRLVVLKGSLHVR